MVEKRRSRLRLGCLIALGILLLLSLWASVGPTRGAIPVPVPDAVGFPGVEQVLEPIPAPLRGLARSAVTSTQNASMRFLSPFNVETALTARLVDWRGTPIEGATLRAKAFGYALEVRSGADGVARLATRIIVGPVGVDLVARDRSGGGWRGRTWIGPGDAVELGDVHLLPGGGTIRGQVVDAEGAPVRGAEVQVSRPLVGEHDPVPDRPAGLKHLSTSTDRSGAFELRWVPSGPLRVWAQKTDEEARTQTPWARSELLLPGPGGEAQRRRVRLVLGEAEPDEGMISFDSFSGRVVDASGSPLAGAVVRLVYERGRIQSKVTGEGGRFLLGRPWKPVELLVSGHGTARLEAPFPENPIEVVLEGGRTIDLLLRGEDGTLPDRATVWVDDAERATDPMWSLGQYSYWKRQLELDGRRLELPVPEGRFFVNVSAIGYRPVASGTLGPELPAGPVELLMERFPVVSGTVRVAGGPAHGATVELIECLPDGTPTQINEHSTGTDSAGRFQFTPRCWHNRMNFERPAPWQHARIVARLPNGEAGGSEPFAMTPPGVEVDVDLEPTGTIRGRVVRSDGGSPAGCMLAVGRQMEDSHVVRLGNNGAFELQGLPAGTWGIGVIDRAAPRHEMRGNYFRRLERQVDLGPGQTVDVELEWSAPPAFRVTGTLNVDGRPAALESVRLRPTSAVGKSLGSSLATSTDTEGCFEFFGSAERSDATLTWQCRRILGGSASVERTLRIDAEEVEVSIGLRTATIDVEPDPLGGTWRYRGETDEGDRVWARPSAEGGRWTVPAGTAEVQLTRDRTIGHVELELAPGSLHRITVDELTPGPPETASGE